MGVVIRTQFSTSLIVLCAFKFDDQFVPRSKSSCELTLIKVLD